MTHATLIGPVELEDAPAFLAVALAPVGRVASAVETDPETALAKLLTQIGAAQLQLDERHASHGAGLKLATGPAPEPLRRVAAELLVQFANQGSLTKITDHELHGALLEAIRAFSAAEPWRYFDSDVAVPCSVSGVSGGSRELSILGSGGLQRGLATYSQPGLYARKAEASEREREALRDRLEPADGGAGSDGRAGGSAGLQARGPRPPRAGPRPGARGEAHRPGDEAARGAPRGAARRGPRARSRRAIHALAATGAPPG